MNKNQIILAVLFTSLLFGQPLVAQEQSGLVNSAKREYKAFQKALTCARQKGFRACSYEEKKRIIRDGAALLAVMAVVTYGGFRGVSWWKKRVESESRVEQQVRLDASLFEFIKSADLAKIKEAIDGGADVNAKDDRGKTPLHLAAERGHQNVAEFLISKHAEVEAKDTRGETPLHLAASGGNKEVAEFLINARASVNAQDNQGKTPLHLAASGGNKEVAEFLISKGAEVEAKDNDGWTPLHLVATLGNKEVAEFLINARASVNAKDDRGETPLHLAASGGNKEVAEFLINARASVNAQDNQGKTPRDVARGDKIKDLLEKAGAKTGEQLRQEEVTASK